MLFRPVLILVVTRFVAPVLVDIFPMRLLAR